MCCLEDCIIALTTPAIACETLTRIYDCAVRAARFVCCLEDCIIALTTPAIACETLTRIYDCAVRPAQGGR